MYQDPHYTRTLEVVRTHFSLYPRTLVYGNSPIYYEDDQGRTRWVLPDCYVAFDVDAEAIQERNGYFMREVGPRTGLRVGNRLGKYLPQRPWPEARALRPARHRRVLAF